MSLTRNIRMLTRYTAWADERIFTAVAELPDGAATVQHPTTFGTMVNTLNHNYVVDLIWQAHLQGRAHGFKTRITELEPPLEELHEGQRSMDDWYIAYADQLSEAAHGEVVPFNFVDGGTGAMTRGDMLLHIVNHKTYHRGIVAALISAAGARPPVMDLPVFLRDAAPTLDGWSD
jgi:uncharacterized damage-inducible protein DinB